MTIQPTGRAAQRGQRGQRALDSLLDLFFLRAQVTGVEQIAARTRLIRVSGPALQGLAWTVGQQVRVAVGASHGTQSLAAITRDGLRTYSIWSYDGTVMELCVFDHEGTDGPGARWAAALSVGDRVVFSKPKGDFTLSASAPYHVFVGEETASVAFGAMLRVLPSTEPVYGVIEVASEAERLPLPRAEQLTWTYRGGASAASSASLTKAVGELNLPTEPAVAYVAGEARTCQAVRDHLVRERGWPRRSVLVKPFWTPGKRGLE
jgi:NADPH-dependent ferric siderophore reductase